VAVSREHRNKSSYNKRGDECIYKPNHNIVFSLVKQTFFCRFSFHCYHCGYINPVVLSESLHNLE
jgi:hypothetical protein